MSNRYWSKWGKAVSGGQVVGFDGSDYYIKSEDGDVITVYPEEVIDLAYKILEVRRKVEGE